MRKGGALVEIAADGQREWSSYSHKPGSRAVLHSGGALSVVSPSGHTLWRSHSGGHHARGDRLRVKRNGAVVVLTPGGRKIWTNHLGSRCNGVKSAQRIIVSISLQHLWACHHSKLKLDTPVTTGAYKRGWITPTGSWHIFLKERNVNLTGPSWDDHVRYWMPYDGPFGLHDASWQHFPEGSAKYKTKGSHGCVHLPEGEMKRLYSWAKVGAGVVVRH